LPEVQTTNNTANNSLSTQVGAQTGLSAGTGSTDPMTLWMLAAGGLLAAHRRKLKKMTASKH